MKNFFSPNVSEYLTPLPQDSSSPFPTEYDATFEKEMDFLKHSSINTRGSPEYVDVMSGIEKFVPSFLRSFFSTFSWLFNHIPFCWIRSLITHICVALRIVVIMKKIPPNTKVLENPHIQKEIQRHFHFFRC